MKAIILAAGLGTRLRPITSTTPKCLVPINGVPLLELWLRDCERAGVEAVLVNTHHLAERVEEFVAARRGIPVTLAYEPTLLGSAGTIAANWILWTARNLSWSYTPTISPPSRCPS
jgi:mannose-1-phosphate guanylyltransferase